MATTELSVLQANVNQLLPVISDTQDRFEQLTSGIDTFIVLVATAKSAQQEALQGVEAPPQPGDMASFSLGGVDNLFVLAAQSAMEFESQMAGLRSTIDFDTPQQLAQMGDDILRLSDRLPVTTGEMVRLVQAAGQAGIARDELANFTQDAVKMGAAFGQTAEQSVTMLADWRAAFGLTQVQAGSLADKIAALSAGRGAGGLQIAGILSALGPTAGAASDHIAALGATLVGVGVQQDTATAGIAGFIQALTAGGDASVRQQAQFSAMGLSATAVAAGMQQDAAGTIQQVLGALSALDAAGRASALDTLFGSEAVGAMMPLIDNLALLDNNLKIVSDSARYSGAVQQIWEQQTATTATQIQLLSNQASHLGIAVGNALLPQINAGTQALMPMIGAVTEFITANPGMVRALAGAAAGFAVLRMATTATNVALGIMSTVASMSPVGLIVRGIAMAAGLLLAYWEPVSDFFKGLWDSLQPFLQFFSGEKSQMVKDLNAEKWAPGGTGIYDTGVASQGYNPYQIQQPAGASPVGSLTVDFVNAPPGMRITDTDSRGLNVDHNVGYTLYNQAAQAPLL